MKTKRKRLVLFLLTTFTLIGGIYFTTTNTYKLLAGYTMYQWNKQGTKEIQAVPVIDKTDSTNKKQTDKVIYEQRPEMGELIGSLYIPKLDKTLPIIHGTNEDELVKGVGHYADSVLPGEKDNSVLSGHRDTVFRRLGEIGVGDELITTTTAGTFTFQVKKVRIVDSDDRTVIVPKTKPTLTVTTCYPFNFIGSAPERYVLVAEFVKKDLQTVFVMK